MKTTPKTNPAKAGMNAAKRENAELLAAGRAHFATMKAKQPANLENVTKAAQAAELLLSDIRQAHSAACYWKNGDRQGALLEMHLRPLIAEARTLNDKLENLRQALLPSEDLPGINTEPDAAAALQKFGQLAKAKGAL